MPRKVLKISTRRTMTAAQCGEELGLSVEVIRDYAQRGCPHDKGGTGKANKFDPDEVAAWMKANNLTGAPGRPSEQSPDIEAAKLREINLRNRKHEIFIAKEEGRLLESADVERGRVSRVLLVKSRLLGLPATMAPHLFGQDVAEIQTRLEKALKDICHEFSGGDEASN